MAAAVQGIGSGTMIRFDVGIALTDPALGAVAEHIYYRRWQKRVIWEQLHY